MQSDSVFKGLAYGAVASMVGDLVTMPVDVTKTRLQLSGEGGKKVYTGMVDCMLKTARAEGVPALWKGIEPALWRQCFYGSLRYGLYAPLKDMVAPGVPKSEMWLGHKILAGGLAGTLAQAVANPCDLVKVRMIGDGMNGQAPRYRWFVQALRQVVREDGVAGLYKGVGANVGRASTLAAAEMASYDSIKPLMAKRFELKDGLPLHSATAVCSGFIAAWVANPFDVVKSRVMNGAGEYKGMVDCFVKTVQAEGIGSLWKGFIPAWGRVGPRVVICFVTMEQLRIRFG
eukprot:TRINITY_DN30695_c0_g1_i1.p1 TRINITY_DN30695_c0_g1~~TRINITY_DN30695_c0_g1_i1.p1  ORF type:complete len:287 (-),score=60.77 TRINITY_DN30695_c0_g1_i1:283-1143(-)